MISCWPIYLIQHLLISHNERGFLSRHSTCRPTQILEAINDWSIAVSNHHAVDVVCFDFAKALDSVGQANCCTSWLFMASLQICLIV